MVCRFCDLILYVFSRHSEMANCILVNGYPSGQRSVPAFQGHGFPGWKAKIMLILEGDELFDIVSGILPCPLQPIDVANDNALITNGPLFEQWKVDHSDWIRRDKAARRYILSALPDSLMLDIFHLESSHAIWEYLLTTFEKKSVTEILYLQNLLKNLQYRLGTSMQSHIESFKDIINQLGAAGAPIAGNQLVTHLLQTIKDPLYDNIITILSNKDDIHFDKACISLIEYSQRHEHRLEKSDAVLVTQEQKDFDTAYAARKRPFSRFQQGGRPSRGGKSSRLSSPNKQCSYCDKKGHVASDCWARQYDEEHGITTKQPRSSKTFPPCSYCGRNDHPTHRCFKQRYDQDRSQAFAVEHTNGDDDHNHQELNCVRHDISPEKVLHVHDGSLFIIDSGATGNMTYQSQWLHNYHSLPVKKLVYLADDTTCQVMGVGDLYLGTFSSTRILRGVLHVPELQRNLLSVARLVDLGLFVGFDHTQCRIEKDGHIIAVAPRQGNLFELSLNDTVANVVTAPGDADCKLWHHRFAHSDFAKILDLHRHELVQGMHLKAHPHMGICEYCALGKHHRLPFHTSTSTHSHAVLDLIHTDICGPFPTSKSQYRYFITFIDDFSRYTYVYLLRHKSEALTIFQQYKKTVELQTGHSIKTLRSDNGGEYISNLFDDFCKQQGIHHEFTVPYSPQQNGVAERKNRTILNAVRCMLIHSGLSRGFWTEAVLTAVFVQNHLPTTAPAGSIPLTAWTGQTPSVSHFRTFGCIAYIHVPKEARHKLDPPGLKVIFLGYSENSKGYRFYDPTSQKIIINRDAIFDEKSMGGTWSSDVSDDPQSLLTAFPFLNDGSCDSTPSSQQQMSSSSLERIEDTIDIYVDLPIDIEHGSYYVDDEVFDDAMVVHEDPTSYTEAVSSPQKEQWKEAMQGEYDSLISKGTWILTDLPSNRIPIKCKWVYKTKTKADGSFDKFKARLVAKGYSQIAGVDYQDTFSPVVRSTSIRMLLAFATQFDLEIHQMDVKTAFLNGDLKEEIYMEQPEGFIILGKEHLVCRLHRALYGLKQASRAWYIKIDQFLRSKGFIACFADPNLYVKKEGNCFIILALYVDDTILVSNHIAFMEYIKKILSSAFEMVDLGEIHSCLGIQVQRYRQQGILLLRQTKFIDDIIEKFGLAHAHSANTPILMSSTKNTSTRCHEESAIHQPYANLVGCLQFVGLNTRPDILFAANFLGQYLASPSTIHWSAAKRVLKYLKGTKDFGLVYRRQEESFASTSLDLIGYTDADWASSHSSMRSTSGNCFFINGCLISWSSKKQRCVAVSTTEAEYVAASLAARELVWLRQLLADLGHSLASSTPLRCDNQSAISLTKDYVQHSKSKHIAIHYHYVRHEVKKGSIMVEHCPNDQMIADIFTKALSEARFTSLRSALGIASGSCLGD